MDLLQVLALAVMQGLTEFLPISSSAHLILIQKLDGWDDQGLAFDVAVHVGTLGAVLLYFRRELPPMLRDWRQSVQLRQPVGESRLVWMVMAATLPVAIVGAISSDVIATQLRSPLVIAAATGGFALVLWAADAWGRSTRNEADIRWRDALLIGGAQALALIPGVSRSGITITAALALGLSRTAAARFSFLLSIPTISMAGGLQLFELVRRGEPVDWLALMIGMATAAVAAYLCIHAFIRLLDRIGMVPFVLYRLLLAGVLFVVFGWQA